MEKNSARVLPTSSASMDEQCRTAYSSFSRIVASLVYCPATAHRSNMRTSWWSSIGNGFLVAATLEAAEVLASTTQSRIQNR